MVLKCSGVSIVLASSPCVAAPALSNVHKDEQVHEYSTCGMCTAHGPVRERCAMVDVSTRRSATHQSRLSSCRVVQRDRPAFRVVCVCVRVCACVRARERGWVACVREREAGWRQVSTAHELVRRTRMGCELIMDVPTCVRDVMGVRWRLVGTQCTGVHVQTVQRAP